mmetsp:Transcript_85872/g.256069  ORF Transcript_85872/g.256069 Transcript_85872/m.256069 type:complete len:208 (+) Transcript_85872:431-1054(+)
MSAVLLMARPPQRQPSSGVAKKSPRTSMRSSVAGGKSNDATKSPMHPNRSGAVMSSRIGVPASNLKLPPRWVPISCCSRSMLSKFLACRQLEERTMCGRGEALRTSSARRPTRILERPYESAASEANVPSSPCPSGLSLKTLIFRAHSMAAFVALPEESIIRASSMFSAVRSTGPAGVFERAAAEPFGGSQRKPTFRMPSTSTKITV